MKDFIFGTLATDELRTAHVRALRSGITHRFVRSPWDPRPGEPVRLECTAGPGKACDLTSGRPQAWVYWSTDGEDPQGMNGAARHGQVTPMELVSIEWDHLVWGYVQRFRAELPGQPAGTVLRYFIALAGPEGEDLPADGGTRYALFIDDAPPSAWARDAIIYQIFVDRFYPGEGAAWKKPDSLGGFYGGTLRGITEKLDYVAGLGANTLWLTPIFPSPSHHGYDATDLFSIEPRLGTKEDLRRLLDEAHARGIRVLLDFVPNHWSNQHATFQAAQADARSPYVDWYTFSHWPDQYETFFGVKELPQINLRHPQARQHVLDAAAYWLEFGVDGYRVDYAIGPSPDFWAEFRRVTRAVRPDCWTFGEVVEPSDSQITFSGLLDGCLDFMLLEALRETFVFGEWDASRMRSFLASHEAFFPAGFTRPSFLDNHDMNRILWARQGDRQRLRLAALCQFTLSGPPIIYYGTEVGLSQERDVRQGTLGIPEEARLPMLWGDSQDRELLSYYQSLTRLRRENPALRLGELHLLPGGGQVLAYERRSEDERAQVYLNLSAQPAQVDIDRDRQAPDFSTGDCRVIKRGDGACLELQGYSGAVFFSRRTDERTSTENA